MRVYLVAMLMAVAIMGLVFWSFAADTPGPVGDQARSLERELVETLQPIFDVMAAANILFTPHT